MKVIDKRTKKTNEDYKYGDILMCWDDDPSHYDLYRISNYADHPLSDCYYIAVMLHNVDDNEKGAFAGKYCTVQELIEKLKGDYDHVEKVNAHIVITD